MSSVNGTNDSNNSYFNYLSPSNVATGISSIGTKVISAVSAVLNNQPELPIKGQPGGHFSAKVRQLVSYKDDEDEKDAVLVDQNPGFEALSDDMEVYKKLAEFTLSDGTKIKVSRVFLAEITRIGQPDQFWIDEEQISVPPETDDAPEDPKELWKKNLLEKMLKIAGNDRNRVTLWTQVWNFGHKMELTKDVIELVKEKYECEHVILPREGAYEVSNILLDTKTDRISVNLKGKVSYTKDINDINNLIPIAFEASLTYQPNGEIKKIITLKEI
jgi:hypothetical protein